MNQPQMHLFELASSPFGLVISPMLNSFIPIEEPITPWMAHRHNYHSLFVLESGYIEINVDSKQVRMNSSSLLLLNPGQVHQCINTKDISGWVLFLDGKFLDSNARSALEQSIEKIIYLELNTKELSFFTCLLAIIHQTTEEKTPGAFQLQMLHSLINALFYQAANIHNALIQHTGQKYSLRPIEITQQFKNLVKEHFLVLKKPSDYASRMNVSVSYLNDTLKAVTGFSSTYFLQQEMISEAQRQLLYTTKTVKEIAFLLGYDDYKYFIRLFTKVVTTSPLKFRKSNQNTYSIFTKKVMIFKTDVSANENTTMLIRDLLRIFPCHQISFDLEDCDKILRMEGTPIDPEKVILAMRVKNHQCQEIIF